MGAIKYILFHSRLFLIACLSMAASCMYGQALAEADSEFREFVRMSGTDGNKEQMFTHLYNSYTNYLGVLRVSPRGTRDYQNAKSALRSLRPYLQNGAGYYSSNQNDDKAILFAKAFIDIPLLDEMKGEFFKQDNYYPTIVYFAAAHCYNVGDYESAMKYFNEYLNTGENSRRSTVQTFMEQAKVLMRSQSDVIQDDSYQNATSVDSDILPDYTAFERAYVEDKIRKWQVKDPYETVSEYRKRVNEEKQRDKIADLQQMAMNEYVQRYAKDITLEDMNLKPYNADHQTFLIESVYGDIVLEVPRSHNEARKFEDNWKDIQLINPQFKVVDGRLTLASLTFRTPAGKKYQYSDKKALAYVAPDISINIEPVNFEYTANSNNKWASTSPFAKNAAVTKSDVDINIPKGKDTNPNTFAVIIANEDYENVPAVPMANNDGEVFSKYCEKTLGLPQTNIRKYTNATYGVINRAVRDICNIAKAYDGKINVIFYYAGHGIPSERTRDAFLMPVDAMGTEPEDDCYSLNTLYKNLGATNALSIVVFLDACFSGTAEDGKSLVASARGVAIKAKETRLAGNMVVFSAASGDQTAFPLREQGHGLFTYFLLKKLQESKGKVTLKELAEYITSNVKQQSVLINKKLQTPTVSVSDQYNAQLEKMTLRP